MIKLQQMFQRSGGFLVGSFNLVDFNRGDIKDLLVSP